MIDSHNTVNIVNKTVDVSNIGVIVAGEQNCELITFKIDRYYDNEDLSLKTVQLLYRNATGVHEPEKLIISKITESEIYISWRLSAETCLVAGNAIACLCFIGKDYALKTKNFKFTVESSIDPTIGTVPPEQNWYVTIEGKINEIEKNYLLKTDIADWAKQSEKPVYTAQEIGAEPAGSFDGLLKQALTYTDAVIEKVNTTIDSINEKVVKNSKSVTDHKTIIDKNVKDILDNKNALNILNGKGLGSIKKTINDAIDAENLSQYATDDELQTTNNKVKHIAESYGENIRVPFDNFPEIGNIKNIYIDSNTNSTYTFDGRNYIRTNSSRLPDIVDSVLIIKS